MRELSTGLTSPEGGKLIRPQKEAREGARVQRGLHLSLLVRRGSVTFSVFYPHTIANGYRQKMSTRVVSPGCGVLVGLRTERNGWARDGWGVRTA